MSYFGQNPKRSIVVPFPVIAHSISRPVYKLLQHRPFQARVLALFERACNLVTPAGKVIALVTPEVGEGPLSLVVGGIEAGFDLEPGAAVRMEGSRLFLGRLEIDLTHVQVWEPRPDWARLRGCQDTLIASLPLVEEIASKLVGRQPQPSPLFPPSPLHQMEKGGGSRPETACCFGAAEGWGEALAHLRAGWAGDWGRLREGAERLAGLGVGLTPAGDDFLCGVMLRAWLSHPRPALFCRTIVDTAAPRTTTLSAALLRAAGRGECSTAWHRLLDVLVGSSDSEEALAGVLAHGATSGADTLAGFLLFPP